MNADLTDRRGFLNPFFYIVLSAKILFINIHLRLICLILSMENLLHSNVTSEIIKAFIKFTIRLDTDFWKKFMKMRWRLNSKLMVFFVQNQLPIKVFYNSREAGEYFADLVIDNKVIIEIKTAAAIDKAHEAQLLNYLKATEIEVGLILNFGQKAEYRRKVFANKKRDLVNNLLGN